jgi:hypothetical protein
MDPPDNGNGARARLRAGKAMLNLLLVLSLTSIGLIAAVIVFLGLAWLVVAVPVVLLVGGCSGAGALRRRGLARRAAPRAVNS